MPETLWTSAIAFLIALVLTPIIRDIFHAYNVVDRPGLRKVHAYPIPRLGGISIAAAYLNEITEKSFTDPDGINGEASRCLYDDINDYNGLDDASARDCFGNVIANFHVTVAVVASALNGVPAGNSRRIDVTVDYGAGQRVVLSGFRMNY